MVDLLGCFGTISSVRLGSWETSRGCYFFRKSNGRKRMQIWSCQLWNISRCQLRKVRNIIPGPFNLPFHPQLGLVPCRLFLTASASGLIHDSWGFSPASALACVNSGSFPHMIPTGMIRSQPYKKDISILTIQAWMWAIDFELTFFCFWFPSYMKVPKTHPIGALSSRTAKSTCRRRRSEASSLRCFPVAFGAVGWFAIT